MFALIPAACHSGPAQGGPQETRASADARSTRPLFLLALHHFFPEVIKRDGVDRAYAKRREWIRYANDLLALAQRHGKKVVSYEHSIWVRHLVFYRDLLRPPFDGAMQIRSSSATRTTGTTTR